ncbi:MAG: 3-dehydroquinate synthase family protein [Spirochaetia bacterium]
MSVELSFDIAGTRTEVHFVAQPAATGCTVTVFDENTLRLFGAGKGTVVSLPPGETSKTWENIHRILERCASIGMERDASIGGVGGGVVCDMAAFAASLYMRGCGLVLVPTTLLAMADASLGGKTGVDFMGYKNLVGSFYPASRILIAAGSVASLPEREYLSGLAEVIKTALIGDEELFLLLEEKRAAVMARDPSIVEAMIRRCIAVKGRIVQEDPKERGVRALLNLGHTFGHALETASGFSGWTHGEAVAWGMGRALAAGERLGVTDPRLRARAESLLRAYGFRLDERPAYAVLAPAFERDKKRRGGKIRLVVACGMCDVRVMEVGERDVAAVLADGAEEAKERAAR